MSRPVPPQVIPRPPTWRPGAPAPWAGAPAARRTGIGIERVLRALDGLGQRGPVPDDVGGDALLGGATIVNESEAPALGHVNAGVLAALFEEDGEARLILTRRSSRLRTHKGEVSFPGGRLNEGEDPAAAARREAYEEVDLDPALVTMVGWLHPVTTLASPALIVPVIAALARAAAPGGQPARGGAGLRRGAGRAGRPRRSSTRSAGRFPGASSRAAPTTRSPCGSSRSRAS